MKRIISFLLSLSICLGLFTQVYANDQLILNGDFSQGTNHWEINKKESTDASIQVVNNELQFTPIKSNNNYWELGFKQTHIQMKNGQKYRLSFEGKASEEVSIKVTVENQDNYTKRLGDTDLTLKTEYQKYEYELTSTDDGLSQLVFHIGENKNEGKDYFFKNISISEIPVQKNGSRILNEAKGVSGTLSGSEEKIQVEVNQTNANWWDLTLKKDNIELQPKKLYQVKFDITSNQTGTMSFDIENTNDYNIKAIDRTLLDIGIGKKTFQFDFVKRNDARESLAFHLSQGDGNTVLTGTTITIENIQFVELDDLSDGYVFNGSFDKDMIGWEIYNNNGSDLSIQSQDGEGVLTFASSQGNDWWDAQFFQKDILLKNGIYKISFDIKADKESSIHFSVQDTNDYNIKYCDDKVLDLSLEYQTKSFEFSILSQNLLGTTKNAKVQFDVGKNSDKIIKNIFIDNVKIEKIGDVDLKDQESGEVHFDVHDVITQDFKGLGVQWDPYQVHPLTDDEWKMVCQRVDYLNPSFVRCMIYATTYCKGLDANQEPIYDFESDDMKALIRELDYLQSRNIEVVLGEWEAPDRFKGAYTGVTVDSPLWAKMISGLMDYLVNEKGYTCIKYFNYVNEANTDWSYCQDYDKWSKGIGYLYDEFNKIDILDKVQITGPDTVWDDGHTWLKKLEADSSMNQKIGLYDVHMYPSIDEITQGDIEKTVREQRQTVSGKDFYMTEIGMVTGKADGDSQPYVKEFSYGVIMADAAAQVMRGGLSGVAIWDLDDAMHNQNNGFPSTDIRSLKQWGFWNSIADRVYQQPAEQEIRPHFYTWSLMTHLFPRHSSIINASWSKELNCLRAVGMKADNNQITYMIVNDSPTTKSIKVFDNADIDSRHLLEYRYFDTDREVNELGYPVVQKVHKNVDLTQGIDISLPGGGVVFLTTIDTDTMTQQGQLEVSHVDETSKDRIVGANFELLNKDGQVVAQWESSKDAYTIKNLTMGENYTIRQISAPKGYVKMSDKQVMMSEKEQSLITESKRVKGQIVLNVKSKTTKKPLSNIEYVLKDQNGNVLEVLKTNKNGYTKSQAYDIADFKGGQYHEINYILVQGQNEYIVHFDYKDDQTPLVIKEMNIEIEENNKTPQTYDSTSILVASMMLASIVVFIIVRKKATK